MPYAYVRPLAAALLHAASLTAAARAQAPAAPGAPPAASSTLRPVAVRERAVTVGDGAWAVRGTLAWPAAAAGPVPGVVLTHGSGPGTQDGDVGPNKVLREVAWALAARGVAVLRYDKRTTAHADAFRALGREATLDEEHVDDAVAAVRLLQQAPPADPRRVFVLALSQGTAVAARVAARVAAAGGPPVCGLVLVSASARAPSAMIRDQIAYVRSLPRPAGAPARDAEGDRVLAELDHGDAPTAPDTLTVLGRPLAYWRAHDPERTWAETRTFLDGGGRVLVVSGGRDYLTTAEDFTAWGRALAGRPRVALRRYPDLNHLMQPGVGRMTPGEYARPMTIAPAYLADVAAWVQTGRLPALSH
ncbi:hypothetical protein tb265_44790 [Gemmatimonadetes bacterium T265]|nr:hypothetical protein tb265_44790 [Gemmatimonadetes bacterium T265]